MFVSSPSNIARRRTSRVKDKHLKRNIMNQVPSLILPERVLIMAFLIDGRYILLISFLNTFAGKRVCRRARRERRSGGRRQNKVKLSTPHRHLPKCSVFPETFNTELMHRWLTLAQATLHCPVLLLTPRMQKRATANQVRDT